MLLTLTQMDGNLIVYNIQGCRGHIPKNIFHCTDKILPLYLPNYKILLTQFYAIMNPLYTENYTKTYIIKYRTYVSYIITYTII